MKKVIGCPAGEWALKLYTVDRFISLEYLLDDKKVNMVFVEFQKGYILMSI